MYYALKKIGKMVKKYRIYNNMEHKDLAESIKKTKPYLSGIERGNLQTHLSEETLKKIANLLNMNNLNLVQTKNKRNY